MSTIEERILIYIALAAVCAFAGIAVGLDEALFSFVMIAAVVEALYWFGLPRARLSSHRRHRTLFY